MKPTEDNAASNAGEPREVTVEKVGRVWATLSNRMRKEQSNG